VNEQQRQATAIGFVVEAIAIEHEGVASGRVAAICLCGWLRCGRCLTAADQCDKPGDHHDAREKNNVFIFSYLLWNTKAGKSF